MPWRGTACWPGRPRPPPSCATSTWRRLHDSGSATPERGWRAVFATLWRGQTLDAACPLYLKDHSYGEYVFDWAWANAYEQHGLDYYPKAVVAVPFTPVPGARLLARDADSRTLLVQGLLQWCGQEQLSSLHLLFGADEDIAACEAAGLMLRHTVQFHWTNAGSTNPRRPERPRAYPTTSRTSSPACRTTSARRSARSGARCTRPASAFRWSRGADICAARLGFLLPLLRAHLPRARQRALSDARLLPAHGRHHAGGLAAVRGRARRPADRYQPDSAVRRWDGRRGPIRSRDQVVAYGRYWGALERVDCLHFEACYYQPLQWCIEHGVQRFEGGAQGEHKMARALMPVKPTSAHWLAHPVVRRCGRPLSGARGRRASQPTWSIWASAARSGLTRDAPCPDEPYLGISTVSMAWITPLLALTSAVTTLASLTITPPEVDSLSSEPSTVFTMPGLTSLAITAAGTT